jgi:hypothetical protein
MLGLEISLVFRGGAYILVRIVIRIVESTVIRERHYRSRIHERTLSFEVSRHNLESSHADLRCVYGFLKP